MRYEKAIESLLKDIRNFPVIEYKDQLLLIRKYQEHKCKKSLDDIVKCNLKFVLGVALLFKDYGLEVTELVNEGTIGLIEAAKRFDTKRKTNNFISYAVWWIRARISAAVKDKGRLIRLPYNVISKYRKVESVMEESLKRFNTIDYNFVAKKVKLDNKTMMMLMESNNTSLDAPINDSDKFYIQNSIPIEETITKQLEQESIVKNVLKCLNRKERKIIKAYYMLGDKEFENLQTLGIQLGVSRERVRQIKTKALIKLKQIYEQQYGKRKI